MSTTVDSVSDPPRDTNSQPDSKLQIAKLNDALLSTLKNLLERNPHMNLTHFLRVQSNNYTQVLRRISEDLPDIAATGKKGYVKPDPTESLSFAELMGFGPDHAKVNALMEKINYRCSVDSEGTLAYEYQEVTSEKLMSWMRSGEIIWSLAGREVIKVDDNLVVKCVEFGLRPLEEASNIQAIQRLCKSMPVPEIVRVVGKGQRIYIFMSYIPGKTLEELWPTLAVDAKQSIAKQLKRIMGDFREVKPSAPCVFGSFETHTCVDQRQMTRLNVAENRLIFSEDEFNKFIMTDLCHLYSADVYDMLLAMIRTNHKIVFTHGDFHPRNIIVSPHDLIVIGIIDWESAGWYPEYWEYIKGLQALGPVQDWWRYLESIVGSYHLEWAIDQQVEKVMIMR